MLWTMSVWVVFLLVQLVPTQPIVWVVSVGISLTSIIPALLLVPILCIWALKANANYAPIIVELAKEFSQTVPPAMKSIMFSITTNASKHVPVASTTTSIQPASPANPPVQLVFPSPSAGLASVITICIMVRPAPPAVLLEQLQLWISVKLVAVCAQLVREL